MEKQFFVKQFLKPLLMAADSRIKDVRYINGVNGPYLIIEREGLYNIKLHITGLDCLSITKEVLKHIE